MQLATSDIDGDLPGDGGALLVARGLSRGDIGGEGVAVADAPAEALAGEHRELQFRHVEPTAMVWGVVDVELPKRASGLGGVMLSGRRVATLRSKTWSSVPMPFR